MEDHLLQLFFMLLRSGLWERDIEDVSSFPLTETQWMDIYDCAYKQKVSAVVFRGINHLPDELMPPQKQLVRWMVEVDAVERRNQQMNAALANLYSGITFKGYTAFLLKGQGLALNYAVPMSRDCGDIDLYFSSEKEGCSFAELVASKGAQVEKKSDRSLCYTWRGVMVEQHPEMLDLQTPSVKRYLKKLCMEEAGDSYFIQPNLAVKLPSPLLNLVLQNSHILKHALGRGVGLRQLCDIARSYYAFKGRVDGKRVYEVYRKAGLLKWSALLHTFLVNDLGLAADLLPYPQNHHLSSQPLKDIVLKGGNFGLYGKSSPNMESPKWKRKWDTFNSFFRNTSFAMRYAPREAVWTVLNLIRGTLCSRKI